MFKREISIHHVFKEWLGEKPTLGDILFMVKIILGFAVSRTGQIQESCKNNN